MDDDDFTTTRHHHNDTTVINTPVTGTQAQFNAVLNHVNRDALPDPMTKAYYDALVAYGS
jgi:hypothetical protein